MKHPAGPAWRLALLVVRGLMAVFGRQRTVGRDRVPREGGLLILANHLSDCDPLAVQVACPRPIHFMSKSELFDIPVLGAILRFTRAFPVKRGAPDREALKYAAALLEAGEAVCVFPEGQLSETGTLRPLLPGVGLILRMAPNASVICLGLRETNRIVPYGSVVPRPSFGPPVVATWGEPKPSMREGLVEWATDELRRVGAP